MKKKLFEYCHCDVKPKHHAHDYNSGELIFLNVLSITHEEAEVLFEAQIRKQKNKQAN